MVQVQGISLKLEKHEIVLPFIGPSFDFLIYESHQQRKATFGIQKNCKKASFMDYGFFQLFNSRLNFLYNVHTMVEAAHAVQRSIPVSAWVYLKRDGAMEIVLDCFFCIWWWNREKTAKRLSVFSLSYPRLGNGSHHPRRLQPLLFSVGCDLWTECEFLGQWHMDKSFLHSVRNMWYFGVSKMVY